MKKKMKTRSNVQITLDIKKLSGRLCLNTWGWEGVEREGEEERGRQGGGEEIHWKEHNW